MSHFGTVGLVASGVAINTAYTVAHKHDPFPTVFAGALFLGGCIAVGGINAEVGTALAALYFLSTALFRGEYFIQFLESMSNSKPRKVRNHG